MSRPGPCHWFARVLTTVLERLAGLLAVILSLPLLIFVAFLLSTNSDEPVLLTDRFLGEEGRPARSYRFRTTGRGTLAFGWFGRCLRIFSLEQLPGFWSVALGQCRLRDLLARMTG